MTELVTIFSGENVLPGTAQGELVFADEPISFMGGTNPLTGDVIDTHHSLQGQNITGKIVAIPSGRGSCSGSGALFEMLMAGTAPAALVFAYDEPILTLGTVIAEEFFGHTIPILKLSPETFAQLETVRSATLIDSVLVEGILTPDEIAEVRAAHPMRSVPRTTVRLSERDERILAGDEGPAVQAALRVTITDAELEGATELLDVSQAHIDSVFYQGPGGLQFVEKLVELGGKVHVPATMNSILVDRRKWRGQGVDSDLGISSERMADAFEALGVRPTYTCAPYQLSSAPKFGEQIVWAESNAVMYANSVLGAKTLKYPDYLDILIALTGRAPAAGTHLPAARRATLHLHVEPLDNPDESLYPTLGYRVGLLSPHDIPVITGLENTPATLDDLRNFGAAFATTSAAPMFHIVGHTPEAPTLEAAVGDDAAPLIPMVVTRDQILEGFTELNASDVPEVGLIAFGNPHFSLTEIARLADACTGQCIAEGVRMNITCNREILEQARAAGYVERIEAFGGEFLTDTCWCFKQPVFPPEPLSVITNSAKAAHYGPAQVGRAMHYGSFEQCMQAALTGIAPEHPPLWLTA